MSDDTIISDVAKQKREKILLYDKLRTQWCSEAVALEAITTSRATLFRWSRSYKQLGVKGLIEKSCRPINTKKLEAWHESHML